MTPQSIDDRAKEMYPGKAFEGSATIKEGVRIALLRAGFEKGCQLMQEQDGWLKYPENKPKPREYVWFFCSEEKEVKHGSFLNGTSAGDFFIDSKTGWYTSGRLVTHFHHVIIPSPPKTDKI